MTTTTTRRSRIYSEILHLAPPYLGWTIFSARYASHHGHGTPTSPTIVTSSNIPLLLLLLLLSPATFFQPAAAQSGLAPSSDPYLDSSFNPSMGVIIIILIVVLLFMGFFSIYIRHCTDPSSTLPSVGGARFSVSARSRRAQRGLDAAVIDTFPTFAYSAVKTLKIGKGALECAVCLNEFDDDDTLRLIPQCDHVFHPECIDAWLAAHPTCPVCRTNLLLQPAGDSSTTHDIPPPEWNQNQIGVEDVVLDVNQQDHHQQQQQVDQVEEESEFDREKNESMELPLKPEVIELSQKLNRNRTGRNVSGRRRWFGRSLISRSNSTGHVAVKQWESMDRYTLRLPADVRRQLMSGKLTRTTSCVELPRDDTSRRGGVGGSRAAGEGSSRRGRFGASLPSERSGRSDWWWFGSLAAPFFSRWPSLKSPATAVGGGRSIRSTRSSNNIVHAPKEDVSVISTLEIEPVRLPV
ncbi:hypothetical protein Dimus_012217 [Dionaea muscipula]